MKFNFKTIASAVISFGGPIVLAVLTRRLMTGKLDIKGAALDAAGRVLADRAAADDDTADAAGDRAGA